MLDESLSATPAWQVKVHDSAPPGALRQAAPGTQIDVDRSGGFLHCTATYQDVEGGRILWLDPSGATVLVRHDASIVEVWADAEQELRIPCLRIVEDLLTHLSEAAGELFVHASAVVVNDRGALLCGNKGAGKTSGLCKLLRHFDADKMANDGCALQVRQGTLRAIGWPGFFKMQVALLALYEELGGDFPASAESLLDDEAALWQVYEKVPLYPRQLADRFGAEIIVEAQVGTVIFPEFDPFRPAGLERLPHAELEPLLAPCVQGSTHPNHPDWMDLGALDGQVRASLSDVLTALRDVPLYRLRWGPSYEDLLATVPILRAAHRGVQAARRHGDPAISDWPPLPAADAASARGEDGRSPRGDDR